MNLSDRLNKDREENEKKKALSRYEEDEETMMYDEREPAPYLNAVGSVFDIKKQDGINTRGAIFDRQAIFNTSRQM